MDIGKEPLKKTTEKRHPESRRKIRTGSQVFRTGTVRKGKQTGLKATPGLIKGVIDGLERYCFLHSEGQKLDCSWLNN